MQTLTDFSKIKILIVGDIMIDRYWWGSTERISPEAPVPVIKLEKTTSVLGGAANVAANVAGLGAQPILIGVAGDDSEAALLPELFRAARMSSEFIIEIKNRPTTIKTRVIAHNQQVARIDQETSRRINSIEEDKVFSKFADLINTVDTVILSDYAKGLLTESLIKRLITSAASFNKIVSVDPKGINFIKYKGADVLTPNKRELINSSGLDSTAEAEQIDEAGYKMISELNLKAILVTKGEEGMMLLEKEKTLQLKASAREVYDVTGAGDTVIATLATAIAAGNSYAASARLANIAAGLVVEQIGTTAIDINKLREVVKQQLTN